MQEKKHPMSDYPDLDSELQKTATQYWAMQPLFSEGELQKIIAARRAIAAASRTVVYAVYENRYARSGGIFAVAENLPSALRNVCAQVVVMSPFHGGLRKAPDRPGEIVGQVEVPFDGRSVTSTIYRYESQHVRWYLFGAAGFFDAPGGPNGEDPYDHSSVAQPRVDSNPLQLRDGLFAAAAIPRVLQALGIVRDVVVHVQDWQLAPTALTVKEAIVDGLLDSAAVVLTSHNPYDCKLTEADLAKITRRSSDASWPRPQLEADKIRPAGDADGDAWSPLADRGTPVVGDPTAIADMPHGGADAVVRRRGTVYECMIPLVDAAVSTVSRQFARDLRTHPLQVVHFTSHLQQVFRLRGLVGVDNGLFMQPHCPFTPDAVERASHGDFAPILSEKRAKRATMLAALTEYRPSARIGGLLAEGSDDLTRLADEVPVFMMFGRMDPGQKGFDVLAQAVRKLAANRAKFIVCPMVPARAEAFLDQWRALAHQRVGDVVIFPFRMDQGYRESMAGATFCIMPSLHEPFGAATEPYLEGSPVVAHATGGLIQQVVDARENPAEATGVLYQVQGVGTAEQQGRQWRAILESADPESRMHYPLYVSLVHELAAGLATAIGIYQQDRQAYGRMLSRLYPQAMTFDWNRAAAEYGAIYDAAARAG